MKKIYNKLTSVSQWLTYFSYFAVIVAVLLTVVDVFLRKFFNNSIYGTYEMMEFLMCCAVFSSFAYTQTKKGHLRVGMFIKKFPRTLGMILYSINELISAGIVIAITYASYLQIGYSIKKNLVSANLFIPFYPFYTIEFICMALFAIILLFDAVFSIMGIFNKEYADEIMDAI